MDKNAQYQKHFSKFIRDANVKECFYYKHADCSGKIVKAHSIQRNGILDLVEFNLNGNLSVYSFLHLKRDDDGKIVGFIPRGKKIASTFTGFCNYHDTNIFNPIENNPVDLDKYEHCFLLAYRGFAKEYHAKKETLKGYMENEYYNRPENKSLQEELITGTRLAIKDLTPIKEKMNDMLERKAYDELDYLDDTIDYLIPLASSGTISPEYSYKNKLLNKSIDPEVVYEYVIVNVFPDKNGSTKILFSCLSEHKKSVLFLDELSDITDQYEFKCAVSSILIGHIENTFFSPLIWNKMSPEEKEMLLLELDSQKPVSPHRMELNGFFRSKINLFHHKYRKYE